MKLTKIVSGGQTGVDRAALDVAMKLGIACGGWCPKGRRAEDGEIPEHYPLEETSTKKYQVRTDWNVRDSDATVILNMGKLEGGTALTNVLAKSYGSPCMIVDLESTDNLGLVMNWLKVNNISTLNIAGPRASKSPEVYILATRFLENLLGKLLQES